MFFHVVFFSRWYSLSDIIEANLPYVVMAYRLRYDVSKVLLDSENLQNFVLVESEDRDSAMIGR